MVDLAEAFLKSHGRPWNEFLDYIEKNNRKYLKDVDDSRLIRSEEVNLLPRKDLHIYGIYPDIESFYTVVCKTCGKNIKQQALTRHVDNHPKDGLPIPRRPETQDKVGTTGKGTGSKSRAQNVKLKKATKPPLLPVSITTLPDNSYKVDSKQSSGKGSGSKYRTGNVKRKKRTLPAVPLFILSNIKSEPTSSQSIQISDPQPQPQNNLLKTEVPCGSESNSPEAYTTTTYTTTSPSLVQTKPTYCKLEKIDKTINEKNSISKRLKSKVFLIMSNSLHTPLNTLSYSNTNSTPNIQDNADEAPRETINPWEIHMPLIRNYKTLFNNSTSPPVSSFMSVTRTAPKPQTIQRDVSWVETPPKPLSLCTYGNRKIGALLDPDRRTSIIKQGLPVTVTQGTSIKNVYPKIVPTITLENDSFKNGQFSSSNISLKRQPESSKPFGDNAKRMKTKILPTINKAKTETNIIINRKNNHDVTSTIQEVKGCSNIIQTEQNETNTVYRRGTDTKSLPCTTTKLNSPITVKGQNVRFPNSTQITYLTPVTVQQMPFHLTSTIGQLPLTKSSNT